MVDRMTLGDEGRIRPLKTFGSELLTTLGSDWKEMVADLQGDLDLAPQLSASPTPSARALEDAISLGLDALDTTRAPVQE
jgi:hypothetical protein